MPGPFALKLFNKTGGIPQLEYEAATGGIIAGTTRTQAGATPLFYDINQVDTSTAPAAGTMLGDGVILPYADQGLDIKLINNTLNPIQVYAQAINPLNAFAQDTINGVSGAVGVAIPPNCVEDFNCAVTGVWKYDAGVGFAGQLNTVLSQDNITALGTTNLNGFQLAADFNRLTTVAAGTGVILPASMPGMDIFIINHGANPVQVYGLGADQIDDQTNTVGVTQQPNSVVIYSCYSTGNWYTEGLATGFVRGLGLQTLSYADTLTAAGTGQSTGLPLTASLNRLTTVGAGTGVNLPASAAGLIITLINNGANPVLVYPAQGAADTINGLAAATGVPMNVNSIAVFYCETAGAWQTLASQPSNSAYNVDSGTGSHTVTAANITGAENFVCLNLTGAAGAAVNLTLPTVTGATGLISALHSPVVGSSYTLRIINNGNASTVWTIVTGTGWGSLLGTMTIALNTYREFVVTLTSTTTATLQSLGQVTVGAI